MIKKLHKSTKEYLIIEIFKSYIKYILIEVSIFSPYGNRKFFEVLLHFSYKKTAMIETHFFCLEKSKKDKKNYFT